MNARSSEVGATPAEPLTHARRSAVLGAAINWLLPATLLVTGMSLRLAGELTPVVLGCVMLAAVMLRPLGAGLLATFNLALAALVGPVSLDDAAALVVFPMAIGFLSERWHTRVLAKQSSVPHALGIEAFRKSRDGIVILDADATVVDANEAFCAMVGHDRDALDGASVMLWQSERSLAQMRELIRSGQIEQHMTRFESVHQRKDGSRYPVELNARVIDLDGERFVIGFVRDISDRRAGDQVRAQEAAIMAGLLETQTRDLVRARAVVASVARAKDCFLANVSHQIRTPLHAIKAFSSLGLRLPNEQPERMRSYMERIHTSAEEMNTFVDDLVILSSLNPEAAAHCFERLDIGLLLQQACMDMHERFTSQSLTLETGILLKGRLRADAQLMSRLVSAMLSHACARAPEGSRVELSARFQAGPDEHGVQPGCLIEVTDTGARLPACQAARAFDAYFEDELMDSQAASTGLLLAICRQIAHLHGGVMSLAHDDGRMALRAWLPISQARDGDPEATARIS